MILANETQQEVYYYVTADGVSDSSGTIEVNGVAELPDYDNQTNVSVQFRPEAGAMFQIDIGDTQSDEQVQMSVVAQ